MEETDNVSIEKKLAYLNETKSLIKSAIIDKGQEITNETPFRDYVQKIDNIETGVDTSDATATANDIAAEQTAYANGQKVTGTLAIKTSADAPSNIYSINYTSDDSLTFDGEWASKYNRTAFDPGAKFNMIVNQNEIANMISLTPDKIIEGNTILGIEGTGKTSEDLQEQLDTQDTIIQQLQNELANKTSGSAKPNIFMQETEPIIKNGIWLKGNYQVDNIVADENVFAGEEWNTTKMSNLKAIPYKFYDGSAVTIGTNVYLFGSDDRSYYKYAYKYDTINDTYTKLTDIPYNFYSGSTVAIGTNIYLFGGNYGDYRKYAYKYDTINDTYTKLTNIPYEFPSGSTVAIGTNVYLFGSGAGSSYSKYTYKYDTLTDTYTKLIDIPYNFYDGSAVTIGTNVYLFGSGAGSSYSKYTYKYDTINDTYTKLTDIPYAFYSGSTVAIGTNIYLFGGNGNSTTAYKYDTLTDTYTQLINIPYDFYEGSVIFNGIDIYLLGGYSYKTKIQVMSMIPNDYDNNSIVISQGGFSHKTNIAYFGIQNAKFYYDRVYYQDENGNLLNTIPTYNGNGAEWVKISGGEE